MNEMPPVEKRKAGRPSEGKERYTFTLKAENVKKAKEKTDNLSALLDKLLASWLKRA